MQDLLGDLYNYCEKNSSKQDDLFLEIERFTHLNTLKPRMLSGNLQGQFLTMISMMVKPKNILEIGTFTGYSAICLAKGLDAGGVLTTIEYDAEMAEIASGFIKKSSYSDQISILIGDAKMILPTLDTQFDLIFIDADKDSYPFYTGWAIENCRSGSLILVDNVLWSGKVLNKSKDKTTALLDELNQKLANDTRVDVFILPLRDGVTMIRKK